MGFARLEEWRKEFNRQRREHPKLPNWAVKQITSDHLKLEKKRGGYK